MMKDAFPPVISSILTWGRFNSDERRSTTIHFYEKVEK